MAKRWQKQELTYLKRWGPQRTLAELAERFRTDTATVQAQLDAMELAASDYSGATPDRGIEPLEQALADLYAGRWERAARRLQKVIEVAEDPHVAARAQEFLRVCTARMAAAEPSPEDPYLQAVVARNEGDLTTALEIAGQRKFHKDPRHAYLTAALHASRGELEQAAAALERALELEPRYRGRAGEDEDFAALRADPAYASLFAATDER